MGGVDWMGLHEPLRKPYPNRHLFKKFVTSNPIKVIICAMGGYSINSISRPGNPAPALEDKEAACHGTPSPGQIASELSKSGGPPQCGPPAADRADSLR